MRILAHVALFFVCGLLASCKKPQASDLPGHYFASRNYGDETLDLSTNGTYVQVFETRTTPPARRTNSGAWQFLAATRTVILSNALSFDDGKGNPATTVVTNDWTLNLTNILSIIMLEDRQAQPFSKD
jgi:hypothetical protein